MKRLLGYFKGYVKESIFAPLFKMLEAIFELLVPLAISNIIDNGIKRGESKTVWAMIGIMVALAVIGLVCAICAQFFAAKAAVGVSTKLRSSLFEKIQSFSFPQSESIGTSTLITRVTGDVNTVQTGINLFLRLFMRSPFIVFGAMIMAFTINVKLALIFVVTIAVLSVIVFGIMLISIPLYKKVQGGVDGVVVKTRSNYRGTRVIRAFNRQSQEIDEFDEKHAVLTKFQLFAGKISALMNPLTYIVINFAVIILIKQGAINVDSGNITQGELVALYNYMTQILVELIKLASLIITLNKSMACMHRINDVFETPSVIYPSVEKEADENEYAVKFENVSFKYSSGSDSAISNISFTAAKGEKIGIIGGTGSGKSTLVNLIPGFYYSTEGSVFVNGMNTVSYSASELRDKIGVVPQKAELFSGSIRSNLSFKNAEATEEELWRALCYAQADGFVEQKEGRLDCSVSQNGANFSGGQKQRLTIARALVGKPEILIFDDSSSALDYATEAALKKAIDTLEWRPTVFIVSQRASSVMSADKIIVLDDGEVAGIGKHDELLQNCVIYREIYESQFGGDEK